MRVRLTEIRLRPTGKKVRLDRDIEVESLFVGRGPDNDLSLKGLTISLHHATIRMSQGRIYIEAAAGKEINLNGLVTTGERLSIGDRIRVGSWELRMLEPETSMDLTLEYEEIDRADNERAALDARTRLGVEAGSMARRPLSWAAIALVFALFLLVPILWHPAQTQWTTGDVSRGHAYIATECQECHTGLFRGVQNAQCTTCHYDIGRHAPAAIEVSQLEEAECADCHLEHRGREASLADGGSSFCSECHADMSTIHPTSDLERASDFGLEHPPFKLAVVTDPEAAPVTLAVSSELEEDSGLLFDHFMHVGSGITDADDEETLLACGACHQPADDGRLMKPVAFEEHCQSCHRLDFESATNGGEEAPHGDPGDLRAFVREFYWARALNGEVNDPNAPAKIRQRVPGTSLSPDDSTLFRRWVDQRLVAAEKRLLGPSGTCTTCHDLESGKATDGGMGVRRVQIQTDWAPRVGFSHDSHSPFTCARCHPAAAVFDPDIDLPRPDWAVAKAIPYELIEQSSDTPISESASDILIPAIDTCRECHAGADANGTGVVPSPCSMCHSFHMREHGTMNAPPVPTPEAVEAVQRTPESSDS